MYMCMHINVSVNIIYKRWHLCAQIDLYTCTEYKRTTINPITFDKQDMILYLVFFNLQPLPSNGLQEYCSNIYFLNKMSVNRAAQLQANLQQQIPNYDKSNVLQNYSTYV